MAQLQFKGKQFVQNHHLTVKFHELVPKKSKSLTDKISLHDNLIIHGDNLKALKALLPTYGGKVKCVYIDPPYNTGNEKWAYNDNVNSPMMREWLGKVVDKEDLTRHDKWLCMMYPRLKLLRDLLSDDGVIFISIDDNEHCYLKQIMDEIFGTENFIINFIRKSGVAARLDTKHISKEHDYVLCYAKNEKIAKFNKIKRNLDDSYILEDKFVKKRGKYKLNKLDRGSIRYSESADFPIKAPDGSLIYPGNTKEKNNWSWRWSKDKISWGIKNGFIIFKKIGKKWSVYFKQYQYVDNNDQPIEREIPYKSLLLEHFNELGNSEINKIFSKKLFNYPKPTILLKELITSISKKDSIILDSFAGSGTTAHAVLDLNKEDGGNRKFILVEMEDYADKITAERVRRVIKGVPNAKDKDLKNGLGGTFSYFELGKPIEMKSILSGSDFPTYKELARYVFYTATGEEFDEKAVNEKNNFIGESKEYKVYLFYKPDIEYLKNTALTLDKAKALGPTSAKAMAGKKYTNKKRLVFAPTKYLDQEHLDQLRIDFAQLPFEIYKLAE